MGNEENSVQHTSILVVFASPRGSDGLRLGSEDRAIRECIDLSRHRESMTVRVLHAASITNVRRALLGSDYRIVHFSGHATGLGLVMEDALGEPQPVPQDALAELLSAYSPPIECVILNACYTDIQGELVSLGVPYTIAISGAISDGAAIEYSRGFYDAIGAGRDFEFAFQEGHRAVRLMNLCDGFAPKLFTETKPPGETEVKIFTQHQVKVEEEEGFLDYILNGTESFEQVTKILGRITERTTNLGQAMQEGTAELESLDGQGDRASLRAYKRILDRSAEKMDNFARELDEEAPLYRDAYSTGIDCYGRTINLLATDFEADTAQQIQEALSVVRSLKESTMSGRDGLAKLRQSIADLPRMTKNLNQAKRRCVAAIDNFDREVEAGLELTLEVEASIESLLGQQSV